MPSYRNSDPVPPIMAGSPPVMIVPKLDWLFWGWFKSFIQYSFVPVVAIAFLMIFEQFVFRYVTTLPPTITSAEYGIYGLQAVAVIATFCIGK